MTSTFYDVKKREKIEAEVIEKMTYQANGQTKYAFKAKTPDGRSLTRFVKKEDYDRAVL